MNSSLPSVLFVEDDADLRDELTTCIAGSGYRVQGAGTLHEAEILLAEPFDLLILDINLPDGSGMELCRRLRPHIRAGIIICTGRSERSLRISGLKDGADAYLVKPVDPEELEATLASVLRRVGGADLPSSLVATPLPAPWRLDSLRRTLLTPTGVAIVLTASEAQLINLVLSAPQRQLSRSALLSNVDIADGAGSHRLEALISRLRRKVFDRSRQQLPLQSIYGKGYIFTDHARVI